MTFHLRIMNLRSTATNIDIRNLFSDLTIDPDGVFVVGGPQGDAFVTFSHHGDLFKAMKMDGQQNLKMKLATEVERLEAITSMCMAKLLKIRQQLNESPLSTPTMPTYDPYQEPTDTSLKRSREYIDSELDLSTSSVPTAIANQTYDPYQKPTDASLKRSHEYHDQEFDIDTMESPSLKQRKYDVRYETPDSAHVMMNCNKWSPHMKDDFVSPYTELPDLFSRQNEPAQVTSLMEPIIQTCLPIQQPPTNIVSDPMVMGLQQTTPVSLFNTLSPESRMGVHRCSILISDLSPDITAGRVYNWVGGRSKKSLGVILLSPSNDKPIAFAIYQDEIDRDAQMEQSERRMEAFTDDATWHFILEFINNWMKWKGPRKLTSPIFETTPTGHDRSVTFMDIETLMGCDDPGTVVKPVTTSGVQPLMSVSLSTPPEDERQFLLIYQMMPNAKASEVLSWFSEAVSAMKLDFPGEIGPRDSEAIAIVLFSNDQAFTNAEMGLADKGLNIGRYKYAACYRFIARLGDICTITRTTPNGDRIVRAHERLRPPYYVASSSLKSPFTLVDATHFVYLQITGFSVTITACQVLSWFIRSKGVALIINGTISAIVAFVNADDRFKSLSMFLAQTDQERPKIWTSQSLMSGTEALLFLAQCSSNPRNHVKLSTPTKQDRDLCLEEANLLVTLRENSITGKRDALPVSQPAGSTSFLDHLKTKDGPSESEALFLGISSVKRKDTACQILSWFKEAICAAKVNCIEPIPNIPETIAYVLFRNIRERDFAKLQYSGFLKRVQQRNAFFTSLRRNALEGVLARRCHRSIITESSPSGVDKELKTEQLVRTPTKPQFTLDHAEPRHYLEVVGLDPLLTASDIWAQFGEVRGVSKGTLVSNSPNNAPTAYVAFDTEKEIFEVLKGKKRKDWTLTRLTEKAVIEAIKYCNDTIMVSTEKGQDRSLNASEKEMLNAQLENNQQIP